MDVFTNFFSENLFLLTSLFFLVSDVNFEQKNFGEHPGPPPKIFAMYDIDLFFSPSRCD